jgi:hypothetical protein
LPFSCPCRSVGERSEVVRLGKGRFGWCNYFLLYRFPWTYGKNFTTIGHYKNALIVFLPLLNWFHSICVTSFIRCLKFHVFMFTMSIAQVIVFLHFKNVPYLCKYFDLQRDLLIYVYIVCMGKWWNIYPWITLWIR